MFLGCMLFHATALFPFHLHQHHISSTGAGIINSTTIFVYLAEFGMAKRNATSELNQDNWNEEEAPEEAGTFCKAAPDVMKHRIIRSAKRRSGGITENVSTNFAVMNTFKL
jgi:hypothetical protein